MHSKSLDTMKNFRVDFSFRKEIFFVIIGSIVGAFVMFIPYSILDITIDTQYYLTWLVFSKVVNSESYGVGAILHLFVGTMIGLVTGIILYKSKILVISKSSNGVLFGIITGVVAYLVFYIPVQNMILEPNMAQIMTESIPGLTFEEAKLSIQNNYLKTLAESLFTHLIWGVVMGMVSIKLTQKFGANYRCQTCNIQFSKMQTFDKHHVFHHTDQKFKTTKILILGGGFGGIKVLNKLQEKLEDRVDIDIALVSEDNFFLFTPMLPEMATGMIEPRHIATPVRTFCKRARFFEASVDSIDLEERSVSIRRIYDEQIRKLDYDYLVIALGSRVNFFGNKNIQKHAHTVKTLGDAIGIRNQIITMLESADQEEDSKLREVFLTFVVVGGGFSGVETVGEINDFIKESISHFYRRINPKEVRVILISASELILPELGKDLGKYAASSLKKNGVEIISNCKVTDINDGFVYLDTGDKIKAKSVLWAGGIAIDPVIARLNCEKDSRGRLNTDDFLRLKNYQNVFALGDCASIIDKKSGLPYPPTAQHTVREAKILTDNIILSIKQKSAFKPFVYHTKGSMAKIGKRNGVALLMGLKIHGFLAWLIWRQYYLSNLPTGEKKIRVALDWMISIFFKPDTTRLRNLKENTQE